MFHRYVGRIIITPDTLLTAQAAAEVFLFLLAVLLIHYYRGVCLTVFVVSFLAAYLRHSNELLQQ